MAVKKWIGRMSFVRTTGRTDWVRDVTPVRKPVDSSNLRIALRHDLAPAVSQSCCPTGAE